MSKQIDFLKRCIALNLQSGGLLDLLDRIEELERERDAFYMDYRMKCDEEVKGSALVIIERDQLRAELAAEQAKNVGLREALEYSIKQVPELATVPGISKALSTQSDTSALEAIVKKAGEVMRDRFQVASNQGWLTDELIRKLPAVTLEDLK